MGLLLEGIAEFFRHVLAGEYALLVPPPPPPEPARRRDWGRLPRRAPLLPSAPHCRAPPRGALVALADPQPVIRGITVVMAGAGLHGVMVTVLVRAHLREEQRVTPTFQDL